MLKLLHWNWDQPDNLTIRLKGAVSRNSAKLGNQKMPVKLRQTQK